MKEEFLKYILPNGIKAIHKRTKSPVVHCAMIINTGSRDELKGEFGMAHLVEHTIFKGTEHRRAYHINCRLENLGGELNAYTSKEETVIQTTSLTADFSKAVELVADILFHSVFPGAEVEKEKEVIFDEINMYKDTPSERIYDDFEDLIFAGSSLGHNILGNKSSLNRLHSPQIKEFINRTYNTDQMVFSVIGNVSEKRFVEIVERYFGGVAANPRGFERVAPLQVGQFEKCVSHNTHQALSIIGKRAYGLNDDERLPLLLLTNMLGGPSSNSVLNLLLREKNALSYNIEATYSPLSDCGVFVICFSTEKDKRAQCLDLINSQLECFKNEPVSARKLAVAKKQFWGQFMISSANDEGYMLGSAKSYLMFNSVDTCAEVKEKIMEVSQDDIMNVAREVFSDMSMLVYR
ncbi:MAG: insulinase family protein [Tidjanibacter sp.]|nr:insulinase family protein [Tidjanibacter sp.]